MTDVDWDLDDEGKAERATTVEESEDGGATGDPSAADGASGEPTRDADGASETGGEEANGEATAVDDGATDEDERHTTPDDEATTTEGDATTADDDEATTAGDDATDEDSTVDAGATIAAEETGWTRLRKLRVALGVGTFAAGLVLVVGAGVLPLSGLAGLLGPGGRALVVVLGLFAGVQGLWAAFRARSASPDLADPPDPEPVGLERPPVTGGEFDDAVERLADPSTGDDAARERVRKDLRRTTVTLLVEQTGCTRAEAATRITRGEWTDDVRAAAFLGGPDAATVPMGVRVREWLAPETPAGQRARRAAEAVVALAEDDA